MYVTHRLMVHQCAKYDKPMSKQGPTKRHVKNPYKFDLEVIGQCCIWIINEHDTYLLMVIHPCAKYGMPISKQKNVTDQTGICTQSDKQTDRHSNFYIPPELCSRGV